jgi:hypothetical protein
MDKADTPVRPRRDPLDPLRERIRSQNTRVAVLMAIAAAGLLIPALTALTTDAASLIWRRGRSEFEGAGLLAFVALCTAGAVHFAAMAYANLLMNRKFRRTGLLDWDDAWERTWKARYLGYLVLGVAAVSVALWRANF